jgi:hypothetical protein
MKNAPRTEEEPQAPEEGGLISRLRLAIKSWKLREIDAVIGVCQRWRSHIEPAAAEDMRGSRKSSAPRGGEALTLGGVDAAKPRGWRGFLIVLALLLTSGIAGMTFSYHLLSRAIKSDAMLIDDLRDQVAQMEKVESRSVNIQARNQQQVAESNKALRECQAAMQGYEDQAVELRKQVSALTPSPLPKPSSRSATARPAAAPQRTAPEKTGNCVMGTSNAVADLTRCVENYNRQ